MGKKVDMMRVIDHTIKHKHKQGLQRGRARVLNPQVSSTMFPGWLLQGDRYSISSPEAASEILLRLQRLDVSQRHLEAVIVMLRRLHGFGEKSPEKGHNKCQQTSKL
jgi:hypothetical protein